MAARGGGACARRRSGIGSTCRACACSLACVVCVGRSVQDQEEKGERWEDLTVKIETMRRAAARYQGWERKKARKNKGFGWLGLGLELAWLDCCLLPHTLSKMFVLLLLLFLEIIFLRALQIIWQGNFEHRAVWQKK